MSLIVKTSQRVCHVKFFNFPCVNPDLGYLYNIWKVNITMRELNLKNTLWTLYLRRWEFHAELVVIFNNFSGTLHFDVMIKEHFYICQTLGEGSLSMVFVDVLRVRWGVTLVWGGQVNSSVKLVVVLEVRGNYVWCLANLWDLGE